MPGMTKAGLIGSREMKTPLFRLLFFVTVAMATVASDLASAQIYPPGGIGAQPVIPYPSAPPPPPPPRIEVPAVPQMNSPPPFALQNTEPGVVRQDKPPKRVLKPEQRPSFSDRVARCLEEGAALGLGPNRRAAYSRACANQ
jgi:hypothetical protein